MQISPSAVRQKINNAMRQQHQQTSSEAQQAKLSETSAGAGQAAGGSPLFVGPSPTTTATTQPTLTTPLAPALALTVPSTPASVLPEATIFASAPVTPQGAGPASYALPEPPLSFPLSPLPLKPSLPPRTATLRLLIVGPASVGKRSLARGLLGGLERKKDVEEEEQEDSDEDEDEENFASPQPRLAPAGAATLPVSPPPPSSAEAGAEPRDSVCVRVSCASSSSPRVLPALRSCYARALAADASPRRHSRGGKRQQAQPSPSSLLFDACLFVLPPHARPGPRDRAAFRALSELVPTIPVLAKADAMAPRELEETQRAVRRALFGSASGGGGTSGIGGVGGGESASFPFSRESLSAAGFEVDGSFGASASRLIVPVVCGARGGVGGNGQQQHPHSRLHELRALLLGTGVAGMLSASSVRFEAFREAELLAARKSPSGFSSSSSRSRSRSRRQRKERWARGEEKENGRGGGGLFVSAGGAIGLGRQQKRGAKQEDEPSRRNRRRVRGLSSSLSSSSSSASSSFSDESDEGGHRRRSRYRAQRSATNTPASFWRKLFSPVGRLLGFPEERRRDGEVIAVVTKAALARVVVMGLSGYLLVALASSSSSGGIDGFRARVSSDLGSLLDRSLGRVARDAKAGAARSERAAASGVEKAAAAAESVASRAASRAHAARENAHARAVGDRSATEQAAAKGSRAFSAWEEPVSKGRFGRWLSGGGGAE